MTSEDRTLIRLFYLTLANSSGGITQKQVDFYTMVLKGNAETRKAWVAVYAGELSSISPAVVALLRSNDALTKEDLVIIAATTVAPKVSGYLDRFISWVKGLFS